MSLSRWIFYALLGTGLGACGGANEPKQSDTAIPPEVIVPDGMAELNDPAVGMQPIEYTDQ